MTEHHDGIKVLSPGAGYGIVIGIGGVFAAIMLCITWLQNRYTRFSTKQSEEFNTASRSVKPGLIASGIVSSWTWSATLLTSSTFAYTYGVCGPMWYAAAGTFQILTFCLMAIKIKRYAPGAHTFPEIVLARNGYIAHVSYLFFGIATNMLVGACLVLGGSQVVSALTGMNVYAACWLIPIVVAAYVIAGGLRSTFIADYIHTMILFTVIFVFGFLMYATSDMVGSPSKFYDLLIEASKNMPIAGNAGDGSYLAFRSVDGLVFAFDLFAAGYSCVWLDQAYWQRAIASRPETSVRAYILGGIAWYGVPFGFATAMGLGCAALTSNPSFPTYPNPLSAAQNNAGLSAPAVTITLLGSTGAILMLILLFMAVTSSTSAELIAVSSLLTFDVYKTYIKPDATSVRLVQISHYGIAIYSLVLAAFCCILNVVNLNLTWLLTILAIIVGGASVPVGLVLLWDRMSWVATVGAPWLGLACGLTAWFVTTSKLSGEISVSTMANARNALAGNCVSMGSGALWAVVLSLIFPAKYQSTDSRHINRANKIAGINPATSEKPAKSQAVSESSAHDDHAMTGNEIVDFLESTQMRPIDEKLAKEGERLAWGANIVFFSIAFILVPFTLFGTAYVYSKTFFTGWASIVSFIWVWASTMICVVYPVIESTSALKEVSVGLWRDIMSMFGVRKPNVHLGEHEA
ncbi:uncharacterized protein MYCFIDRAFT_152785 [Pseudocercospora fijiensis CIRAD86]|uniref:Urea transporter n=1 Tax=Pseudocercospora fijiensis (strain CIRAD86) TaxID=383855 RepID=M2Z411_PSEFD|nr:uncharacterized protein MYCFIDRAFT_152785 [Pseudocercospora fijiensis CIRAD86]EME84560.1 hypothetical protein MYCFIDRAFT_152785 [Pseudocercospora fijiensis CIRAD86]